MSQCCGQERCTPFCPMCGKRMVIGDAASLLVHIRKNKRVAEADVEERKQFVCNPHTADGNDMRRLVRARDRLEQWSRWEKLVEPLTAQSRGR